MAKLIKTETLEMREMFEYYYSLGKERSFAKVIKKYGVSETSVKRYARSFNWVARVEQRDLANADELERRTNETIVNSKARYREVIKDLTDQFVKDVADGKIKIRSTKAFVELVQLDMELMGDDMDNDGDNNVSSLVEVLKGTWGDIKPPVQEQEEEEE